jgi:LDH2 family malate/lactate/ureidoglycolate dehydrogenase
MAVVRVDVAALEAFLARLYAAVGLPAPDAAACAAQTVDAEARGVASHGCVRTRVFVERLRRGTINPTPDVRAVVDLPGWALLDGDRGMAAVAGRRAMDIATAKAAANGIGAAGVRRVSHTGHVGWFASMALAHGMIGVVASSAAANMAPAGGAERLVGNGPLAFAIPSRDAPVVFDMATSKVARGWIMVAEKTGAPIPDGWALDADGAPTTDARRALDGTLLPAGDHKGFGLALVVGLLTNALTGNAPESAQGDWLATDREFLLSMLVLAIDPVRCLGGDFESATAAIVARLKASRLAPGADEIRIPGERSARTAADARTHGIALDATLADELDRLALELGVDPCARR